MAVLSNTGIRAGASAAGGGSGYKIEKSLRFDPDDTAHLEKTPSSSTSNQKQFTFSFWTKIADPTGAAWFQCGSTSQVAGNFQIYVEGGKFTVYSSSGLYLQSSDLFRDTAAWYHYVVAVDTNQATESNRVKAYVNGTQITDWDTETYCSQDLNFLVNTNTNHEIGNIRNSGGTQNYWYDGYIADWHCIDGQTLDPSSFGETDSTTGQWLPKKYAGSYGTNGIHLKFDGTDLGEDSSGNDNDWTADNLTQSVQTISSPNMPSWSTVDSGWTAGTDNRNGTWSGSGYGHIITGALTDSTTYHFYLDRKDGSNNYGGWFFTDTTDPSATVPDEFGGNSVGQRALEDNAGAHGTYATANGVSAGQGAFTGWDSIKAQEVEIEFVVNRTVDKVWMREASASTWIGGGDPTNTSSTATFLLPDGDTIYFGCVDHSGSGYANIKSSLGDTKDVDVSNDTPTTFDDEGNGTGNYATLSPLDVDASSGTYNLKQGNLVADTFATNYSTIPSTIAFDVYTTDGYYFESIGTESGYYGGAGITEANTLSGCTGCAARDGNTRQMLFRADGYWYYMGNYDSGKTTWGNTDCIGIAVKDGKVWVSKNGSWLDSGNPATGANPSRTWLDSNHKTNMVNFFIMHYIDGAAVTANFGQRPFKYTPPSGFKALNTYNLPDPVISDPSKYFGVTKWDAATAPVTVDGLDFKPDLAWIKNRSGGTHTHVLTDSVRGVGKQLYSNLTSDEGSQTDQVTAFTDDGYTLGDNVSGTGSVNISGATYVGWNWDAGTANTVVEYDNSDTWSDDVTNVDASYPATRAFDGNTATTCYATAGTTAVFTPASAISGDVYVMAYAYQAGGTYSKLKVNGTDYTSLFGTTWWQWIKVPETSLTNLSFGGDDGTHFVGLLAVKVGDKLLLDSGASTASLPSVYGGGLHSSLYNTSADWSSSSTLTTPGGAFDGTNMGGSGAANYSSGGETLTTSSITIASKLEIYTNRTHTGTTDGTKVTINSTDYYDKALAATGWSEVDLSGATLPLTTSGAISIEDEGGSASGLWGIRVDGKILVDDDVTPDSVPTIESTYRVNNDAGFSIVSYEATGVANQNMAHGLNAKPDFMIFKSRDSAANWNIWHKDYTTDQQKVLYLNSDSEGASYSGGSSTWWYASPDSSVFWYGEYGSSLNMSDGDKMIAYCWSEVKGYSRFGSYTGNDVDDGAYVHCGFKPAFVMIKNTTTASTEWIIVDNVRDKNNVVQHILNPNDTTADDTSTNLLDFTSNGFKLRSGTSRANEANSNIMIYAAFADKPFKYSNAV